MASALVGNRLFIDPGSTGIPIAGHNLLDTVNSPLVYGFTVIPDPSTTRYYGFSVGGNGLFLLDDFTVVHNSTTAIAPAERYVTKYRELYASALANAPPGIDKRRIRLDADRDTPSVFVLGFGPTRAAFFRDLLGNPLFKYTTREEIDDLAKYERSAEAGQQPNDVRRVKEIRSRLRRRITDKSRGGFYRFMGYQKLVNALFISEGTDLVALERSVTARARKGEDVTLESAIRAEVEAGRIRINRGLLAQFAGSYIICDEFHHTYNMNFKNNYGVAVQYILDTHGSNVSALFMSATICTSSASEMVDALNYTIIDPAQRLVRRDLFTGDGLLKPGAEERLAAAAQGRVSFLQESSPRYYPSRSFDGEVRVLSEPLCGFRELPYIRYIITPMSRLQQATVVSMEDTASGEVSPSEEPDEDMVGIRVPSNGYSIYDMVFPNPNSATIGIYKSSEAKSLLTQPPADFRERVGVVARKVGANAVVFGGRYLSAESIAEYSTKYAAVLRDLELATPGPPSTSNTNWMRAGGKIMIYHDRVRMSGVLLIGEMLRENGYLDETSSPTDTSRCAFCCGRLGNHDAFVKQSGLTPHQFYASRFVSANSEIDNVTMLESLAKFNSPDNMYGQRFRILVGSKILREGYEVKDVRHLFITMLPVSIPTLIQVMGRCIRKGSHFALPPEDRHVNIRVYLSVLNNKYPVGNLVHSPEEIRWAQKFQAYQSIQETERSVHAAAVDSQIHRLTVMSPDALRGYFPGRTFPSDTPTYHVDGTPQPVLGNLYFNVPEPPISRDLNTTTYTAYGYDHEETETIVWTIKRLFTVRPVYTYDSLLAAVRAPPFPVVINPRLFSEDNFVVALSRLVDATSVPIVDSLTSLHNLFDPADRLIPIGSNLFGIGVVGEYYVRFPVVDGGVIRDVQAYGEELPPKTEFSVDLVDYVNNAKSIYNYESRLRDFAKKFADSNDIGHFLGEFDESFYTKLLSAIIENAVSGGALGDNVARLYSKTVDVFDRFRALVYPDEVIRYGDVAKKFTSGTVITDNGKRYKLVVPKTVPIGFLTRDGIRLYDGRWFETSRVSMNRVPGNVETTAYIGYFESLAGATVFKLRRPIQSIRSAGITDNRTLERGMVCSTKTKSELIRIAEALNIRVTRESKIRDICESVKNHLLEREMKYRQQESKSRAFYLWYDTQPTSA